MTTFAYPFAVAVLAIAVSTPASAACPAGFLNAGNYCIEINEHNAKAEVNWLTAVSSCRAAGQQLCTSAQWAGACVAFPNQLTGLFDSVNGEWVDDRVNVASGNDGAVGMGSSNQSGQCDVAVLNFKTSPLQFRCCHVK